MLIKVLITKILIVFIGLVDADQYMKTKADFIKTCAIKDPMFTVCAVESSQKLFNTLSTVNGIEGLENVRSIDPMRIKRITINQVDGGPISINSTLKMAIISGFSKSTVHNSFVNKKDISTTTSLSIPKIRIEGQCRINGRVLVVPLNVNGHCVIEPSGLEVELTAKSNIIKKFGHYFSNVTSTNVQYTLKGLKIRITDLNQESAALGESANAFLNDNWMPFAEALKPLITQTIEGVLLNIWKKTFKYIPADYFYSDIGDYVN